LTDFLLCFQTGCRSFGRYGLAPSTSDEAEYMKIASEIVADRNKVAHCIDISELEELVHHCVRGINRYPEFQEKFPNQCQIILRYNYYKQNMPNNFK